MIDCNSNQLTPYFQIDQIHYIYDNDIHSALTDNTLYSTINFDILNINNDNILYLYPLIQSLDHTDYLKDYTKNKDYNKVKNIFKRNLMSLAETKIKKQDYIKCIDLQIIKEYYKVYKDMMLYLHSIVNKPVDYEYLKCAYIISEYISKQSLLFRDKRVKIRFNPFTTFGRFGLQTGSFNILSLKKDKRIYLQPISKDYIFYEFDYNAFEIRTLLSLLKIKQPKDDLYEVLYNMQNNLHISRNEYKRKLLQSLYSQHEDNTVLGKILNNKQFYRLYPIINGKVRNVFGKEMETDEFHLLSRVLQSSAAYILFQQMFNIIKYLRNNDLKSKLSFSIHDSICLSIHKEEVEHINNIKEIIENVNIKEINYTDNFPVTIKSGINYGEMKYAEA